MARENANRNLLFGVLALQMNFVSRDALVAALNAWALDRSRPLGQVLVEQEGLRPNTRDLLEALVAEHLERHGGDPDRSLASLRPDGVILSTFREVAEPEVRSSLPPPCPSPREVQTRIITDPAGGTGPAPGGAAVPAVSRYRVLRAHAQGGLGLVSLAVDEHLHREVALKEIQDRHADDPELRARFLLEAEVTGSLEHPGIVPVYGLGWYPDGRPYYAMRFIRGQSLREAIARFHESDVPGREPGERALALRGLLRRFVDVCNAVAYAHSRGVLHRDLKPANVMLGPYGETLVVDWGLAKVAGRPEPRAGEGAPFLRPFSAAGVGATQAGSLVGTPAYMSPEQAQGRHDELGPPSDVYSLGATLYHLLAGKAPFPEDSALEALLRVARGEFPPPGQLKGGVPRALESVCLKAMAPVPGDRYPTAEALARDVEHFLADEPVAAGRDPWLTRARRWARRHRVLVAGGLATLVVAALALAVTALVVGGKNAELAAANARERAAAEQARQTLEDMTSEEALQFLETQKELRPEQRRFLEQVVAYYQKATEARPAGEQERARQERARQARAYLRMGKLQERLGLREEAEAAYRAALTAYDLLAREAPEDPAYRQGLASNHFNLGKLLAALGKRPEAERAFRAALGVQEDLAADHPGEPSYRRDLARTHNSLGIVLYNLGRRPEAEQEYRSALRVQERLVAEVPRVPQYRQELGMSHDNLGTLLKAMDRCPEAEGQHRAAVTEFARLAAEHPREPSYRRDLAVSRNNLGNLLTDLGRFPESETQLREALKDYERLAGEYPQVPEYRFELAMGHNNLGFLLTNLGRRPEAEDQFRAALQGCERLVAENSRVPDYRFELAASHNNLGDVLRHLGRRPEAEDQYHAAHQDYERLVEENPLVTTYAVELGMSYGSLAALVRDGGEPAKALEWYARSIATLESVLRQLGSDAETRRFLRKSRLGRAVALARLGRHAEAIAETEDLLKADAPAGSGDAALSFEAGRVFARSAARAPDAAPAEGHASRALALLRQAVADGYKDVEPLQKDSDFDSLRARADFKKLLEEVRNKK